MALEKAARMRSARKSSEPSRQPNAGDRSGTQPFVVETIRSDNPYLVTISDPASPISEEYKKLKSSIIELTKREQFKNVLLVTSSAGGEGKSITALNLAISLSQEYDHSVLLIDADLRKPSLHEYLDIEVKTGLSDCFVDGIDIGDALIRLGSEKLTLLPSGKKRVKPVELFSSKKMQKLIYDMKYRYPDRYIIIDSPPVLLFAETKMMSSFADGVILVVQENKVSLQDVGEALEALKHSRIMGIVYNNVNVTGFNGRSYYYSYYGHYYGKHVKKKGA